MHGTKRLKFIEMEIRLSEVTKDSKNIDFFEENYLPTRIHNGCY
jgi:hypothetical protein